MGRGAALGAMVVAGAGWGAVFVAPELAPLAPALLLAMGRFVSFGAVSATSVLWSAVSGSGHRGRALRRAGVPWGRVAAHAVTGSLLYYALVALAVRMAGPTLAVATIGLVPVVMAVASALSASRRRAALLALAPSLGLVGLGQVLVHAGTAPADGGSPVVGTLLAVVALASWSWYGVDSHRLLSTRPDLGPVLATAQGLAAAVLALPVAIWLLVTDGVPEQPVRALLVMLFLGLVSSWLAVRLWHAAAGRLSPMLVSQLMALETAWGFVFAAVHDGALPSAGALVGEVVLVAGVVIAVLADRGGTPNGDGAAHRTGSSASTARDTRSAASRVREERASSAVPCAIDSSSAQISKPTESPESPAYRSSATRRRRTAAARSMVSASSRAWARRRSVWVGMVIPSSGRGYGPPRGKHGTTMMHPDTDSLVRPRS